MVAAASSSKGMVTGPSYYMSRAAKISACPNVLKHSTQKASVNRLLKQAMYSPPKLLSLFMLHQATPVATSD